MLLYQKSNSVQGLIEGGLAMGLQETPFDSKTLLQ